MCVPMCTHLQQLDAACCDLDLEVVQAQAHGGPPPAPQVRGLTQGAVATAGHVAQDAVKGTRVPAYHTPHARHIKSNMIVEAGKARPLHASNRQGSHHWRTFCQVSDNAAIVTDYRTRIPCAPHVCCAQRTLRAPGLRLPLPVACTWGRSAPRDTSLQQHKAHVFGSTRKNATVTYRMCDKRH